MKRFERIDLEHFPTCETSKRMLARVSPIYERSYVGKWLYQVMGLEMEDARRLFDELRQQAFPETATWHLPSPAPLPDKAIFQHRSVHR